VHFYLKRSFGYYLVQVYIPSILTCLISFVSFWIDHKAVPARISVGLLTVLTVTTQSSGKFNFVATFLFVIYHAEIFFNIYVI